MADSDYEWLPDRHLGVASTLSHADELIGQAGELLFKYQAQSGDIIGLREESDGWVTKAVVDQLLPIPRKLSLVVADALVALRGALEHTIFAEIEHQDGPLDEKAAKLVEMPAKLDYEVFEVWKKGRSRNGPRSLQSGSELLRRIEWLQPFQRRVKPAEHPLARLVLHTNHAKHRTPAVAAILLPAMYLDDERPQSIAELEKQPEVPLRIGDMIAETPRGEIVPMSLFPTVGINRPGTEDWPILMHELKEIADWVRKQALPRLITGGDPPKPEIPARFEISVGHEDERQAIAAGSQISAIERQTDRLAAASARVDLADLIGGLSGTPSAGQLSDWLAQLPDKQVIERVERLEPCRGPAASDRRRTMEVLYGLRREALEFIAEH